jgi:hypothetical protein
VECGIVRRERENFFIAKVYEIAGETPVLLTLALQEARRVSLLDAESFLRNLSKTI